MQLPTFNPETYRSQKAENVKSTITTPAAVVTKVIKSLSDKFLRTETKGMSTTSYTLKVSRFDKVLSEESIDLVELKKLSFNGIPDSTHHRSLVWRLLLNYLPTDRTQWAKVLAEKRQEYWKFGDEILPPHSCPLDPLNPDPSSPWENYFKDNEVLLQIDKDVRRLYPSIHFFQSPTPNPHPGIISGNITRLHTRVNSSVTASAVESRGMGIKKVKAARSDSESNSTVEAHWEVVERILFVYAKLNKGQSYVQGMNEIIGPIYYTLATDPDPTYSAHAEPDTFYLFTNLMAEIRDFFIRSLDNSSTGIKLMMDRVMEKLKSVDYKVYSVLIKQEIYGQYFCFRWLTLLLSQEFDLPDVLRIWDSLLSDPNRFDFLIQLCTAMIVHLRDELIAGDFSHNMKLLQNFPCVDVSNILHFATRL